ncbi:MAG TPA: hypothetical protein PKE39_04200 [Ignavibacteria bacterium]|nr:hypothetical protein [Ignavibacteria bacterium]HMQ98204.1 hypothetical protein [Ignavibacteria bacterium]
MDKIKFFSFILLASAMVYVWGCGDDSTNNNNSGTPVGAPDINIVTGSAFYFTNDTISQNNTSYRTLLTTKDSVLGNVFLEGYNSFAVRSVTDSLGTVVDDQVYNVYYDAAGGKFYQYGIFRFLDPTASARWDLVADFNLPLNTSWDIGVDTIVLSGFSIQADIKGKIAEQTTFQTTNTPSSTIHCYRIEISANLSIPGVYTFPTPVYFDYYLGFASSSTPGNPSGIVRLRLRPISLALPTQPPFFTQAGGDRILRTFIIP